MKGPLRFHTTAPSYNAPRHRARHVSSQLAMDQSGNEHLLLHFFVESTHPDKSYTEESSLSLSDLSLSSAYEWSKTHASNALDASKSAFAYLVGSNPPPQEINTRPNGSPSTSTGVRHTDIGKSSTEGSSAWSFAGLFGGIRTTNTSAKKAAREPAAQYTEGEVHADLVKDESGDFKYRYLLVDLPREWLRSDRSRSTRLNCGMWNESLTFILFAVLRFSVTESNASICPQGTELPRGRRRLHLGMTTRPMYPDVLEVVFAFPDDHSPG